MTLKTESHLFYQFFLVRFTIVVNDAELGYNVKALTGINMDTKKRDHIIEELFKIDGVREVAEVTGRFDILVEYTTEEFTLIFFDNLGTETEASFDNSDKICKSNSSTFAV